MAMTLDLESSSVATEVLNTGSLVTFLEMAAKEMTAARARARIWAVRRQLVDFGFMMGPPLGKFVFTELGIILTLGFDFDEGLV